MTLLDAIILGLVEGITEYLPISSTGHLIIASALLGLDTPEVKDAVDTFNIVIQGGAILAVAGLYFSRIVQMLRGLAGRDRAGRRLLVNLFVAFLPAAVLGPLLNDVITDHLFRPGPVLAALLLGGVWMIWLDRRDARRRRAREAAGGDAPEPLTIDQLDTRRALAIGLFQAVAMWPGTSRSMMTIAGGTLLGMRPRDAAEFSFLLGLPTLGGACLYSLGKDYLETRETGEAFFIERLGGWTPALVGVAVATISAAVAVRWLVAFLNRHGLGVFGVYRIALALAMFGLILAGVVTFAPA
jgi:undecaprenyl-diphosphatase